ncbi:AMP-binding enzyme [Streptomyces shenzhenensis]
MCRSSTAGGWAALRAHPGVRTCAVVAYEDAAGTCALAAYVVPVGEDPPSPAELRGFLARRLPRSSPSTGCPAPPTERWTVRPCPSRRWPPHSRTCPAAVRRRRSRTSGPTYSASTRPVSTTTSSISAVTR